MKTEKRINFKKYLKTRLKDKEIKMAYEEAAIHLKIAHLAEKLRLQSGLTLEQFDRINFYIREQ